MENLIKKERYNLAQSEQGFNQWFKPQIIYDLVQEEKTSLTFTQVFNCFTSDVQNHQDLKAKLKQNYPNISREIDEIFNKHSF